MPPTQEIADAVRAMVDAVNAGDIAAALAAFTDAPTIIEDVPPFRWQGPSAASDWLSAMAANAAQLDVEAIEMRLRDPTRIETAGDNAYGVFPGMLALTTRQARLVAEGVLTLTLRLAGDDWRIETLVWSGPPPAPLTEVR
jgi:ketosteroid isomerase-like protein